MPEVSSTARAMAMAAHRVISGARSGGSSGRKSTDSHSPFPSGDAQARPRRPLPASCVSLMHRLPWGAPARAICLTSVLVEPVSCR